MAPLLMPARMVPEVGRLKECRLLLTCTVRAIGLERELLGRGPVEAAPVNKASRGDNHGKRGIVRVFCGVTPARRASEEFCDSLACASG